MEPIGPIGIISLGHIAPIGRMEPIGPIGINPLGHTATIGTVEPIGPIGIYSTYRANWADGTNWPNWHQFNGTCHQLLPWNQVAQLA